MTKPVFLTIFFSERVLAMISRGIVISLFFVLLSTFLYLTLGSFGIIQFPKSKVSKSVKTVEQTTYNKNVAVSELSQS